MGCSLPTWTGEFSRGISEAPTPDSEVWFQRLGIGISLGFFRWMEYDAWTTEPTEPMIRHASFIRTRRNYDFKWFQLFSNRCVFYMPFFKKGHHKITLAEEHQIGRDLFASNSQVPPLPTSPCCRKLSPPNPPDIWGAAIDFPAPRPQEMIPSSPSTSAPTRRPPNSAHWRGELESPQAPPAPQSPNFTAIFWGSFWVWGLVVVYFFTFPFLAVFFFRGGPITTWTWVI